MAKSNRQRSAAKDDPIYKGGLIISSHPAQPIQIVSMEEAEDDVNLKTPKNED